MDNFVKISLLTASIMATLIIASCSADAQHGKYKNIKVEEMLKLQQDSTLQILDVRTEGEYTEGHISEAKHIDVLEPGFQERATDALDKTVPVLVYCRSGGRSRKAAATLAEQGYRVYNLKGGYKAYAKYSKRSSEP